MKKLLGAAVCCLLLFCSACNSTVREVSVTDKEQIIASDVHEDSSKQEESSESLREVSDVVVSNAVTSGETSEEINRNEIFDFFSRYMNNDTYVIEVNINGVYKFEQMYKNDMVYARSMLKDDGSIICLYRDDNFYCVSIDDSQYVNLTEIRKHTEAADNVYDLCLTCIHNYAMDVYNNSGQFKKNKSGYSFDKGFGSFVYFNDPHYEINGDTDFTVKIMNNTIVLQYKYGDSDRLISFTFRNYDSASNRFFDLPDTDVTDNYMKSLQESSEVSE